MSLQDILFGSFVAPIAHSTRSNRIQDINYMTKVKERSENRVAKRLVVKQEQETLHPPLRQKIVDALHKDQWISLTTISNTIDCNHHSISKHVKPLIEMRRIVKKVVSGTGPNRYTYLKLRTPEDKRDVYSETRNRDDVIVKMMQEKFCTIEELQKKTGIGIEAVHKALERIRKKYVYQKLFKNAVTGRVFYYMIVGERK